MNEFVPQHPDRQSESAMKNPHYTVYLEGRRDGSPMQVTEFATADPEQPSYLLTVKRSDGELDEGWLLGGIVGARDGLRARVVKPDAAGDGIELSKHVPVGALIEQNSKVLSEEYLERRYGASLEEMVRIAAENDHGHDREVSPVVQEVGSSALKAVGVEVPVEPATTVQEANIETPVEAIETQPEVAAEVPVRAPSPERVLTDDQKGKQEVQRLLQNIDYPSVLTAADYIRQQEIPGDYKAIALAMIAGRQEVMQSEQFGYYITEIMAYAGIEEGQPLAGVVRPVIGEYRSETISAANREELADRLKNQIYHSNLRLPFQEISGVSAADKQKASLILHALTIGATPALSTLQQRDPLSEPGENVARAMRDGFARRLYQYQR